MFKRLSKRKKSLKDQDAETKAILEAYEQKFNAFEKAFDEVREQYLRTKEMQQLEEGLKRIAQEYPDIDAINLVYFDYAKELSATGDEDAEIKIYEVMERELAHYDINKMDMYLRSAHYYFTRGDENKGVECLLKLCDDSLPSNYEEAMEWHGLSDLWKQYRYYLDGKLPSSLSTFDVAEAKSPEECSMYIAEIFALPKHDLLASLSEHIYELSGEEEHMDALNEWESIFFDVDNMMTDIGSDGIAHFLTSHGHRFAQTKKALNFVGASKAVEFLELIEAYFPKGKIPKSYEKLEALVDDIMETEESFDAAEDFYTEHNIEKELVEAEYQFAMEQKANFR